MTSARTAQYGAIGLLLVTAVACGGSPPPPPAAEKQPPQNAAQAAQQVAQGLQQMAQSQTANPVEFEQLIALLPEPAGWTRGKPEGKQWSMGVAMSMAEADYEKGDSRITLSITDTAFNQLMLAPLSFMLKSGWSERSTEGYKKAVSIGGSPGYESWEIEEKDAEIGVVVGNRFLVSAKGRDVDSVDVVRSFVQAVNLSKLSTLK